MLNYLRLVRIPNLLIIMLTQALVRYCLILPAFKTEYFITGTFPQHLSDLNFYLLMASTVLIAAAGYIINDYFDVNIDEINKPGKNLVGKIISLRTARILFFVLSGIGAVIGLYVFLQIPKPMPMPIIGILPLFSAISLYMYSSFYKRRLFTGNLIVALLCAITVLLPGLFEPEFYRNFIFLSWFAVTSFLLTLIREIIKDMQDIDGDELSQCKTAPIIFGIPASKRIVMALIVITAGYISYVLSSNFRINDVINFWYLIGMFLIPLAALFWLVAGANEKKDFYYASTFTKIIMVGGIGSIYLFWKFFLT